VGPKSKSRLKVGRDSKKVEKHCCSRNQQSTLLTIVANNGKTAALL